MINSEFCLSPATEFSPSTERGQHVARRVTGNAASLARALVNDADPEYSRRRAIQTAAGPAAISVTRFGGPMETPTLLGALFVREDNRLVVETHGLGFPYDAFKDRPDVWCGVAGIAIAGSLERPETASILVTPHLRPNLVEEGYFLEKALEEADHGARGYGSTFERPADPREDNNALLVVSAFRDNGHLFAHPALNEALETLPQPAVS